MKKILLSLALVMLLAVSLAFGICAEDAEAGDTACEHDWFFTGYDEENMPTCDIEGIANYECLVCGETKTENVFHRLTAAETIVEGQEPTCTEYGYATYECVWCSVTETRKIAPRHAYEVTETVNATCTEAGSQTFACTLCGDSYTEELPANGHNQKWQYDSTTATCTQAGVETYGCWNCDATFEVEVEAYGHDWNVDDSTLDLEAHTVDRTCNNCGTTEKISSFGMEADPITITIPGSFTASVTGDWTYYTFTHAEGYITFTFDTTNVNALIKDTTGTYETQYFWGGDTTWQGELMASGKYVIAISSSNGSADIAVTTEFEETDVPDFGEIPDKAILIEGTNTAYTSTGKVWYTFETPSLGTVTITVEGNATVSYGTDATALTEYTAPFVDEYGYTTYYIFVESEEEATIIINVEAPVGSMDNPLTIVVGQDNIISTQGGWATYYAQYTPEANGTLTITFDSEKYANVIIQCGTHPYMMYTPVTSGDEIEVSAWTTTYYFGITTEDYAPVEFTLTAAFEETAPEAPEPEIEIGELIGSMDVTTTNSYGYNEEGEYDTYIAESYGQYTFFVPAGLGFYSKTAYDAWKEAEIGFYDNEAGAYVTVTLEAGQEYSFYVGATTEEAWTIDVYYFTHVCEWTETNRVDATCIETGTIYYACECGETKEEVIPVDLVNGHDLYDIEAEIGNPTDNKNGKYALTSGVACDLCGEYIAEPEYSSPDFKINSASLALSQDINIIYTVTLPDGYTNPYMVFYFGDSATEYLVEDFKQIEGTNEYEFKFTGIKFYLMNENVNAYLYATVNGKTAVYNVAEYSVKQYCVNKLKDENSSDELVTLISDLLVAGAKTQIYEGKNTDNLITDVVVAAIGKELSPSADVEVPSDENKKAVTNNSGDYLWKSATLKIGNATYISLEFTATSIENLKIKVNIDGVNYDYYFSAEDFNKVDENKYSIDINQIKASKYASTVTATFWENGVQVCGTATYSVNSYVYSIQNNVNADENALALANALYNYGKSVVAFEAASNN